MFTDLHFHLLHGIDDGPQAPAEALAMARVLVSCGFGAVAVTPHAWPQLPGREEARARREELSAILAREAVALCLHDGAENRLDELFLEGELAGQGRHLGGTRYTLVEAPYDTVVPNLPEILFRLTRKGVRPVIAHPERCAEFQELSRVEEAVRLGALLQLDLGSLAGTFGRGVKKTAARLLEGGFYTLAATDLHEAQGAEKWLRQSMKELESRAGAAAVTRLLSENPARLLRDEEL